jgi:hypothetical protein
LDLIAMGRESGGVFKRNGETAKILGRTRLSLNRDRLAIVTEADTKDSRFPSESAFCSLHRFGDLRDWCSSFRMRFEFLNVFLRPRTAMRCRFLRRHEQSP